MRAYLEIRLQRGRQRVFGHVCAGQLRVGHRWFRGYLCGSLLLFRLVVHAGRLVGVERVDLVLHKQLFQESLGNELLVALRFELQPLHLLVSGPERSQPSAAYNLHMSAKYKHGFASTYLALVLVRVYELCPIARYFRL